MPVAAPARRGWGKGQYPACVSGTRDYTDTAKSRHTSPGQLSCVAWVPQFCFLEIGVQLKPGFLFSITCVTFYYLKFLTLIR